MPEGERHKMTGRNVKEGDGKSGDVLENVGLRIRFQRKALGLNQTELAQRIGNKARAGYISDLERGHANITLLQLQRIADALDVEIDSFFSGEQARANITLLQILRIADALGIEIDNFFSKRPNPPTPWLWQDSNARTEDQIKAKVEEIRQAIKERRKDEGLTLQGLADRVNISNQKLSYLENYADPKVSDLMRLAAVYNVPFPDLTALFRAQNGQEPHADATPRNAPQSPVTPIQRPDI